MEREKTILLYLANKKSLEGLDEILRGEDFCVVPTCQYPEFEAILNDGWVHAVVFDPALIPLANTQPYEVLRKSSRWIPKLAYLSHRDKLTGVNLLRSHLISDFLERNPDPTELVQAVNALISEAFRYPGLPTSTHPHPGLHPSNHRQPGLPTGDQGRPFGWDLHIEPFGQTSITLAGLLELIDANFSPAGEHIFTLRLREERKEELGDVLRLLFPFDTTIWLETPFWARQDCVYLPVHQTGNQQDRQLLLMLTTREQAARQAACYTRLAPPGGRDRLPNFLHANETYHFGGLLFSLDRETDLSGLVSIRKLIETGPLPLASQASESIRRSMLNWTSSEHNAPGWTLRNFCCQALGLGDPGELPAKSCAILEGLARQLPRINAQLSLEGAALHLRSPGEAFTTVYQNALALAALEDLSLSNPQNLVWQPAFDTDTLLFDPDSDQGYFTSFSTLVPGPGWWGQVSLDAALLLDGPVEAINPGIHRLCQAIASSSTAAGAPTPVVPDARSEPKEMDHEPEGEGSAPASSDHLNRLADLLTGTRSSSVTYALYLHCLGRLNVLAGRTGLPGGLLHKACTLINALAQLGQAHQEAASVNLRMAAVPIDGPAEAPAASARLDFDENGNMFLIAGVALRLSSKHKMILAILWNAGGGLIRYETLYAILENNHKPEYQRKDDAYQVLKALRKAIASAGVADAKNWINTNRSDGWRLEKGVIGDKI